jgi:hypothetical protein
MQSSENNERKSEKEVVGTKERKSKVSLGRLGSSSLNKAPYVIIIIYILSMYMYVCKPY